MYLVQVFVLFATEAGYSEWQVSLYGLFMKTDYFFSKSKYHIILYFLFARLPCPQNTAVLLASYAVQGKYYCLFIHLQLVALWVFLCQCLWSMKNKHEESVMRFSVNQAFFILNVKAVMHYPKYILAIDDSLHVSLNEADFEELVANSLTCAFVWLVKEPSAQDEQIVHDLPFVSFLSLSDPFPVIRLKNVSSADLLHN